MSTTEALRYAVQCNGEWTGAANGLRFSHHPNAKKYPYVLTKLLEEAYLCGPKGVRSRYNALRKADPKATIEVFEVAIKVIKQTPIKTGQDEKLEKAKHQ